MATINLVFTIPDNRIINVRNDFCSYHGWTATIPDPDNEGQTINNPESQGAFIKRKIGEYVKDSVRAKRAKDSSETARLSSITDTDANDTFE